ncbi:hypothetical protein TBLA_0J00140 [Henningerozyma blattae CBS 6284]|uniref:Uncharacterized protein n=1 Tax=Henningerozyma blattae (strain ATCC 34711 / CBS 6284 / DSM 70876 / NBRC 10599 / NRRL Y-10934 / UCD 77-7) TaxID=1071380 RepID=I2H9G3_HENB6|nr:hypothetical protein TBLA_0J00140 [Tetrapisispora blattae CBS 6284]CCH63015.1 hypothetical protein TBLA_0J00140 [Tetrapisispora blattae CBS 6284]
MFNKIRDWLKEPENKELNKARTTSTLKPRQQYMKKRYRAPLLSTVPGLNIDKNNSTSSSENRSKLDMRQNLESIDNRTRNCSPKWSALQNVFTNKDRDLSSLQKIGEDIPIILPRSRIIVGSLQGNRLLRDRIKKTNAFKRKLIQKRYDEKRLKELNGDIEDKNRISDSEYRHLYRNNSITNSNYRRHNRLNKIHSDIYDDEISSLKNQVENLEEQLRFMKKQHISLTKQLRFAQEKNVLLESSLDEAKIDNNYLKSRRHIKNLEKENLKPTQQIPASPKK